MGNKRKAAGMKEEKKKKKPKHLQSEVKEEVPEPEPKIQKVSGKTFVETEESSCHSLQNISDLKGLKGEEEQLTPEEKRRLERKLKKERKKEQKKLMRETGVVTKKEEAKKPSGSELALEYLTSWSENPKEWKFQKARQTWLLLHMYDKDKVPDEYFSIVLKYLEGLQGNARQVTVQKAEDFMQKHDSSETEDAALVEKCERIRKVLQLLS